MTCGGTDVPPQSIDVFTTFADVTCVAHEGTLLDELGFERVWMPDGAGDAFTVAGAVSQHLPNAGLGTSIAVPQAREATRWSLAFYATTKAYARTFETEGLGDLAEQLR